MRKKKKNKKKMRKHRLGDDINDDDDDALTLSLFRPRAPLLPTSSHIFSLPVRVERQALDPVGLRLELGLLKVKRARERK